MTSHYNELTVDQCKDLIKRVDERLRLANQFSMEAADWEIIRCFGRRQFGLWSDADFRETMRIVILQEGERNQNIMAALLEAATKHHAEEFVRTATKKKLQTALEVLTKLNVQMAEFNNGFTKLIRPAYGSFLSRAMTMMASNCAGLMLQMAKLLQTAAEDLNRLFPENDGGRDGLAHTGEQIFQRIFDGLTPAVLRR
ncbi:hypothetical protein Ddc_15876 [Ditylenchus destructor]|nr:hypothetical protein Ddc_15876 [Ditylenchus destructor]